MRARTLALTALLAAAVLAGPACKRDSVSLPSPVGPSTIYQTFTLTVGTDVIVAGAARQPVQVKATLKQGNAPVMGTPVYFMILTGPGYFSDFTTRVAVLTDENGVAAVTYLGPLKGEIASDTNVYFRAQLSTDQIEPIYKETWIHILLATW